MRQIVSLLFFIVVFIVGCTETISKISNKIPKDHSSKLSLDSDQASDTFKPLEMVEVQLDLMHDGILASPGPYATLDLACSDVLGVGNNWTQTSVIATTSVEIPAGFDCTITLAGYNDGRLSYYPVSSSLVISVSSSGSIIDASPLQYGTGGGSPTFKWFAAYSGGSYSVIINYTDDAINVDTNPTIIDPDSAQIVSLSIAEVYGPTVSDLSLYILPPLNGEAASYTLTANVSGSTGCTFIDNSSGTYTPTSWDSVNTAYSLGDTCPQFVDGGEGFTVGNWTSYWVDGKTYLIVWANTVDNMSAYTTANIGPTTKIHRR